MKKQGSITREEKNWQRKKDLAAAQKAQETNDGKKPYRMDRRTVILAKTKKEAQAHYRKIKSLK